MKNTWENHSVWLWIFAVGLLAAGYMAGLFWPAHYARLLSPSLEEIQKLALRTNALHSPLHTSLVIFLHNIVAAIVVMILTGLFTAGIYPAWGLWMNGLGMGYVVSVGSQHLHVSPWQLFLYGMLPHGIFELPAFVWSAVLGMRLGYVLLSSLFTRIRGAFVVGPSRERNNLRAISISKPSPSAIRSEVGRVLRQIPYVAGLLVIAAAIEGTVTPHLLSTLVS